MAATAQKIDAAGGDFGSMLKDGLAAAVLTFLLAFPIIMLHAEADNDGNLFLTWRPYAVLILCVLAFVGRILVAQYQNRPFVDRPAAKVSEPTAASAFLSRYLGVIGLAVLFVFPFAALFFFGKGGSLKWIDSYGIQILIYVMLGWGLNIVVGLAGLLDLGYVAFYAVGAYSYALLATRLFSGPFISFCMNGRRS